MVVALDDISIRMLSRCCTKSSKMSFEAFVPSLVFEETNAYTSWDTTTSLFLFLLSSLEQTNNSCSVRSHFLDSRLTTHMRQIQSPSKEKGALRG